MSKQYAQDAQNDDDSDAASFFQEFQLLQGVWRERRKNPQGSLIAFKLPL